MSVLTLKAEAEAFFARSDIWANLVTMRMIADRAGVAIQTPVTWQARYSDFPAALAPTLRTDNRYAYMALYWWPDVRQFMRQHDLPGKQIGKTKP